MKTKFLSLLMAVVMVFSLFSITVSAESLTEVPEGYKAIYTVEDLYFVRNDLAANYILMNDIDLSEATAEGGDWNYGGRGWNPIGSDDIYSNSAFSGIFDGNNYSITGLNIDIDSYPAGTKPSVYVGLFACVTGTIKNLTVEGKITTNRIQTYTYDNTSANIFQYFGGIAAYCYGTIQNCKNKVNLDIYSPHTNSSYRGNPFTVYVGGVCGYGYVSTIENCANYANINVKVKSILYNDTYCAGIVAYGSPTRCINNGDITAINCGSNNYEVSVYAYGIARDNPSNCYNSGNITAKEEKVYDYIGYSSACGISGFAANNCYNVGKIDGVSRSNAINGNNSGNSNCYYLEGTGGNSTGSTSLTEAQMKLQGMYSGWDFDNVWTMEGREDYPYPELRDVPLVLPEDSKTEITGTVTVKGEAKVGSTLTAEITDVTPADATFEYEWKADGKIVGTESTYTVTQEDAGKNITLTVKGNGDFKGNFSSTAVVGECVHNLGEFKNNNDATCDKNATQSALCSNCNKTITEEIANSTLQHVFENYIYDENATCTADGTKTAKCENCDATDTITAENTKTKHEFSDNWFVDKDATCTEEGIKSHHCKNCDATKDETVLNKVAHIYIAEIIEATCFENGEVIYTCSCGDSYSKTLYSAGHIDSDEDGICDECSEKINNCDCNCHKSGIVGFIWKIINFFSKLFGKNEVCACGVSH